MKTLAVAVGLVVATVVPLRAQTTIDTLSCYKVNDSTPRSRFQARVRSGTGSDQSCIFKTPARMACVTTTSDVTPPPVAGGGGNVSGRFLCYQARCPGPSLGSAGLQDPFGSRAVTFRAARFVCIPAASAPNVTTTTVQNGGTTSTTVPTQGCHFSNGKCTGTCGGGGKCGSAVGTGSCECRKTSCGDADAPTCDGACDDPGDACVFNLAGCTCVSVP
jgi:hypothetical protein